MLPKLLVHTVFVASLGAAIAMAGHGGTLAQTAAANAETVRPIPSEPTQTTETYGSWVLRCVQLPPPAPTDGKSSRAPGRTCEVVQTVQVQGQPQPIAQVAIGRFPGDDDLVVTALLPVNISLPGEVRISGNGKTGADERGGIGLVWTRCLSGTCIATAKPDAETLAILRRETEGQLRFADAAGSMLSIPLSWSGLDQAMTALDRQTQM